MWIAIMTFALLTAVSYLIYFDRHVRSSAAHHLAAVVTADISSAGRRIRQLRRVFRRTSSRIRALIAVTVVFVVSWYPLHAITIVDPGFRRPFKVRVKNTNYWTIVLSTASVAFIFTARCTLVQSAVLRSHVVCLSVRPSVTLVNCDHIG